MESTKKTKDGHPHISEKEANIKNSERDHGERHLECRMNDQIDDGIETSNSRVCTTKQYQSTQLPAKQICDQTIPY